MKKKIINKVIWEKTGSNNIIRRFNVGKKNCWFLSYNPCTSFSVFDLFLENSGGQEETAICTSKGEYAILNGDFRKEFDNVKTEKQAIKIYKNNIRHRSYFTTFD